MHAESITLTVPARSDYAKTVRMTAAQLASRIGMSYDEVDDVRIAAEEAFVYACSCVEEAAAVTFTFAVEGTSLEISVGPLARCCAPGGSQTAESYAEFILRSVCDEFSVEHGSGECRLRLACRAKPMPGDAGA
jgi:serine/threonine-protein kinase RsbW